MSLLFGVLIASVLGSVHCAAMCGGFVCLYAGGGAAGGGPRALQGRSGAAGAHAAYHAGRLASYLLLGAAGGALGARVDQIGALAGLNRAAAIATATLLVLWGVAMLAATFGLRWPRRLSSAWSARPIGQMLVRLRAAPPSVRAGMLGLLTSMLPCGWLYAFVVTAAGTGSASSGVAVMAVFWLGTVPLLLAIGVGVRRIAGPFASRLPAASAVFVIALGALALAGKLRPIGIDPSRPSSTSGVSGPGGSGIHGHR